MENPKDKSEIKAEPCPKAPGKAEPCPPLAKQAMKFFTLGNSKNLNFSKLVFMILCSPKMTIQGMYVKACVRLHLRVFHGILVLGARGGGGPKDGYTTCFCSFSPSADEKLKFSKLVFMIL